ncbi:MAG: hypothetical protein LBR45_01900 [Bacteroidales bacterium]|jgi:hypothetical protein|nr:hypothetical protein [Bacteroidales bacterium]
MKQKIQYQVHYTKVGRLSATVAKQIRKKAADIYVDENHVKHIFNRHSGQLKEIGFTPLVFLEVVMSGYNRIYKGNGQSLLLAKWNGVPKIAAIEMNFALKKEFYEVKTAFIKAKEKFKEEDLLWQKK